MLRKGRFHYPLQTEYLYSQICFSNFICISWNPLCNEHTEISFQSVGEQSRAHTLPRIWFHLKTVYGLCELFIKGEHIDVLKSQRNWYVTAICMWFSLTRRTLFSGKLLHILQNLPWSLFWFLTAAFASSRKLSALWLYVGSRTDNFVLWF